VPVTFPLLEGAELPPGAGVLPGLEGPRVLPPPLHAARASVRNATLSHADAPRMSKLSGATDSEPRGAGGVCSGARVESPLMASSRAAPLQIPKTESAATVRAGTRDVHLTNLPKVFFPETGLTKGGLLQYYADVAPLLIPHVARRAMVMKRYPNGAPGAFFFMKRTPSGAPSWLEVCRIEHGSGNVIDFPMVDDLATLLWIVNLGCIDLNQWYSTCDDVDRPDYLHFDLDPVKDAQKGATGFEVVREAALELKTALEDLGLPAYAKTSGSSGIHVYVPIVRGPLQKEVWRFAKALAFAVAARRPDIMTAEYKIAKRPVGRVLVDYNQNAWGRTLASVYSVRPTPRATVSTPVTWDEVRDGIEIADFRVDNVRERFARTGDLWAPLLHKTKRAKLERFLEQA
jgi:bifunctional non-homologous end joining protein LigD